MNRATLAGLRGLMSALAANVTISDEKKLPTHRFDGEEITTPEDLAAALSIPVVEAKARIRHVRTSEGARRFGQPIGSVITTDLLPHSQMFTPGEPSNWTKIDDNNHKLVDDTGRFKGRIRVLNAHSDLRQTRYHLSSWDTKSGENNNGIFGKLSEAIASFEKWRDSKLQSEDVRRVKPKSKKRFVAAERWGIYGKDWWYGTDDEANLPEWDEGDRVGREEIAMHMTKGMNLAIDEKAQGSQWDLAPDYHEVANEFLASMEDNYPGFTRLLTTVGTSSSLPNALAFNAVLFPVDERGFPSFDEDYMTGIYWNPYYYGKKPFNRPFSLHQQGQEGVRHWSVRGESVKTSNPDYTGNQQAFLATTAHEVGHSVARVVAFRDLQGVNTRQSVPEEERGYYQGLFWSKASTVFENHGLGNADEIHQEMTTPYANKGSMGVALTLNEARIKSILSHYGATNLHEMFAEVWAEYQLDPEPRTFSAEIGAIMEEVLEEWLYWTAPEE